jgi:uncharacterized Fe-S radical SAM superfamily protein PflX
MIPTKEEVKKVLAWAGSIKSEKKAKSSAENGKMGGRPKKPNIRKIIKSLEKAIEIAKKEMEKCSTQDKRCR